MINNIKVGDRLEITLSRDRKIGKSYVSQVEDIMENKQFLVHMPISYGQLIKLSDKEKYYVLFFTDKGMIGFEADVIKHVKEHEFHYTLLSLTSDGERMQRREFFRFVTLMPLKYSIVNEEEINLETSMEERLFDGIIKDIGGGGIRFVSNENLNVKIKIKCIIIIDDKCLVVVATILHKQYFPKADLKFQYRAQFVNISKAEQEIIIQHIFSEQRKNIQKQGIAGYPRQKTMEVLQ